MVKAVLRVETLRSLVEREHEQVRVLIPERYLQQLGSNTGAVRSLMT